MTEGGYREERDEAWQRITEIELERDEARRAAGRLLAPAAMMLSDYELDDLKERYPWLKIVFRWEDEATGQ